MPGWTQVAGRTNLKDRDVAGKSPVALVTGAARGLGAETARQLAGAGWRVLLVDSCADNPAIPYHLATAEDLESSLGACREAAGGDEWAAAVVADVCSQTELDGAVDAAVDRFGRLDAVVAAAGVIAGGPPAWDTEDPVWSALLEVNLTGVWRLARASIPVLVSQPEPRRGRFVAVSSAAGLRGIPGLAAYSAAKHGVIGLVRSMAAELGGIGVTANVVCPGSMNSSMLEASAGIYGLTDVGEFAGHHLIQRLLEPPEVAALIVWLCSESSSGVTGSVFAVDGGMTAKG